MAAGAPPGGGSGAMFDLIAHRYDRINRLISLGLDQRWRRRLVAALGLGPRGRVLDVACGTADVGLAVLAAHPAAQVVGIDPSARMLEAGAEKLIARRLDGQVRLVPGDAECLPFAPASFDAVACAFGVRNIPDRARALGEMARVVKPGGVVAILELNEPAAGPVGWLARGWVHGLVPRLGAWLAGAQPYRYLSRSIAAFPPPAAFANTLAAAGLGAVRVMPLGLGAVHLYVGRRPS